MLLLQCICLSSSNIMIDIIIIIIIWVLSHQSRVAYKSFIFKFLKKNNNNYDQTSYLSNQVHESESVSVHMLCVSQLSCG